MVDAAARWSRISGAALMLTLLAGPEGALAQPARTWVDPPARPEAPPAPAPSAPEPVPEEQPAPVPKPAPQAQPAPAPLSETPPAPPPAAEAPPPEAPAAREASQPAPPRDQTDARAAAARNLTMSYLKAWSAPNEDALDAMADFYAPRVLFHGKSMKVGRLMREKKRFVRRWPERRYRPLEETIQVACAPTGEACSVQSLFDFDATNPRRDRHSEGTAALQLIVSFPDGQPVIAAESSLVLDRGGERGNSNLEDLSDD